MKVPQVSGAVLSLVLLTSTLLAADLDPAERRWVEECVKNMGEPSPRVRASAEQALAAMGPEAAGAVEALRPSWPEGARPRLDELLRALRGSAPAAKDELPRSPPDVDAKVREILETYRGVRSSRSGDPNEARLVALGRPALGTLVQVLCDAETESEWAMRHMAQKALERLGSEDDVPMLVTLIRDGHRQLESAFASIQGPRATEAVAALVRDGRFDTRLDALLASRMEAPNVVIACIAWLREPVHDRDVNFAIAKMADVLSGGDRGDVIGGFPAALDGPVPLMFDAAPAFASCLERDLRVDARRRVAAALVRLGDKSGFPVLIDVLAGRGGRAIGARSPDEFNRWAAGKHLDAVTGLGAFDGKSERSPDGMATWTGNHAEAAEKFGKWWDEAKEKLVFDRATRKWSVK